MKFFIASVQLNTSSTVFDKHVKMFLHYSKGCNKIYSSTVVNDSQWWCGSYAKFHAPPQKESHGVRSVDRGRHYML